MSAPSQIRPDLQHQDINTKEIAAQLATLQERVEKLEAANQNLERLATIDPLTEVLNRRGLQAALTAETHRARRAGTSIAALLVDCDDFKSINDRFGHAVGDLALREVARRLQAAVRCSDTLGRIGGDEFLVFLPNATAAESALVSERICFVVAEQPLPLPERTTMTCSVGLAILPANVSSLEEVLAYARLGLSQCKRQGKNRSHWSGEHRIVGGASIDKTAILKNLCSGEGLSVKGQSINYLPDGKLAAYELFIRGPRGPFENPNELFLLARAQDMLTLLDLRCLRVCARAASNAGFDGQFHINLFPTTLLDVGGSVVLKLLDELAPGCRFCIELCERQMGGDPTVMAGDVLKLRKAGVLVAVDQVGLRRGSLESLLFLEPDIVKVDKYFVQGVSRDPSKRHVLERLVRLVKSLGGLTVAGCVEEAEDLRVVRELGMDYGQGFLFGQLNELLPSRAFRGLPDAQA